MLTRFIAAFLAATIVLIQTLSLHAQEISQKPRVGVCLILAVDVSSSVSRQRFSIQMKGYSAAFTNPSVLMAIEATDGIAVQFMQWGGQWQQHQSSWFLITNKVSAEAFAFYIAKSDRKFTDGGTYLGDALAVSIASFKTVPYKCERKVIDISGDGKGRDNEGGGASKNVPLKVIHERAQSNDITINGLPIMGNEYEIDIYYRDEVITGENSFIEVVKNPDDISAFSQALIRKLLRELSLS